MGGRFPACRRRAGWRLTRAWQGVPLLQIGTHLLQGQVAKLKKPLTAIQREGASTEGDVHYRVVGTVRRKLLFKTRPRPVAVDVE